jgi:hypothetical protein
MESLLVCPKCGEAFDLTEREPLMMICCGNTVCGICLNMPQEKFKCNFCESEIDQGRKPNILLRNMV